jgi:surfeit locus 1 family protein
VVVAAVCVRLGFWQLSRHAERRDRNARIEARSAGAVVDLDRSTAHDSMAYRRATAAGTFDWARQVIEYGRSLDGVPGVVIVTPLRMASGQAVLVERGWVPSPDARRVDLAAYGEPDSAIVHGLLIPSESARPLASEGWPMETRAIDPVAMASRFPYPLVPLVLRRTAAVDIASMRPFPPPERTLGPHLSYAVQWFLFATIAVGGGVSVYVRSRRSY